MTRFPQAYTGPCSECPRYGNCSPGQAVKKLNDLEMMLRELKKMIIDLNNKINT